MGLERPLQGAVARRGRGGSAISRNGRATAESARTGAQGKGRIGISGAPGSRPCARRAARAIRAWRRSSRSPTADLPRREADIGARRGRAPQRALLRAAFDHLAAAMTACVKGG